jgi:hypothetical protein
MTPTPTAKPTLTPTPSPQPTATPEPTATPYPVSTGVFIECIFYDGIEKISEGDEYVQIKHGGTRAVDLKGWSLKDMGPRGPTYEFEKSYELGTGEQIRVYTNRIHDHDRGGGFSFGRKSAIWRNDTNNPDTAGLFDPSGRLVSEKSYPPGCGE